MSKKVGGPKNFMALLVAGGSALGVGGTLGCQKIFKIIKFKIKRVDKPYKLKRKVFEIIIDCKDNNGLSFIVGDKIRILDRDGDSLLIEKIGDDDSPYFISQSFLKDVSDFKKDEEKI